MIYERHKFFTRSQGEGENTDHYVIEFKLAVQTCEFGELCDSLIKDHVVYSLLSDNELKIVKGG